MSKKNVKIPEDLHSKIKIISVKRKTDIQSLLEQIIKEWLANQQEEE